LSVVDRWVSAGCAARSAKHIECRGALVVG
jgi:hypothetical protein